MFSVDKTEIVNSAHTLTIRSRIVDFNQGVRVASLSLQPKDNRNCTDYPVSVSVPFCRIAVPVSWFPNDVYAYLSQRCAILQQFCRMNEQDSRLHRLNPPALFQAFTVKGLMRTSGRRVRQPIGIVEIQFP